jgi:hypothetical protein
MTQIPLRTVAVALAAALLPAVPAAAQTSVGIKGGVTLSSLSTTPDAGDTLSDLTGFAGGAFVVLDAGAPLTAMFETMVSRRGADVVGEILGFGTLGKLKFTYLDISAFVRGNAGSDRNHFYVFAGPTFGIQLKAEFTSFGFSQDIGFATEDWDVAATAGAGLEVGALLLEGRYSHGLRNILVGIDFFGFEAKHRTFTVLAGVRF